MAPQAMVRNSPAYMVVGIAVDLRSRTIVARDELSYSHIPLHGRNQEPGASGALH